MNQTSIHVQGTDVFIEGEGAQTVVMIHGWPDTHRLWDGTVQALQGQVRCVRFTMPGSEGPPTGKARSLAEITAQLRAILDAVSPDQPVTLLLHDWGCVFGYELAARHPERVARIVAVDIGDTRSPEYLRALGVKEKLMIVFYQIWLAKCWVLGRFVNARFADYWTRLMARLLQSPAPQSSVHWYMNTPYAMTWLGLGGGMRGLARFEPHCPVLFVYGTRKPFMFHSQPWLDTLNARPGSKAVGLPTGHWVMVGQAKAFQALVLDWLAV